MSGGPLRMIVVNKDQGLTNAPCVLLPLALSDKCIESKICIFEVLCIAILFEGFYHN